MKTKSFYLALILLSAFLFIPEIASAQSSKIDSLKKELLQLKIRINKLESQLNQLSQKYKKVNKGSPESKKTVNLKPFQIKANWRKLEIGMTREQVTSILGEPTRITAGRYSKIWWYEWVDKIYYIGHVSFDKNNKVVLWVEP